MLGAKAAKHRLDDRRRNEVGESPKSPTISALGDRHGDGGADVVTGGCKGAALQCSVGVIIIGIVSALPLLPCCEIGREAWQQLLPRRYHAACRPTCAGVTGRPGKFWDSVRMPCSRPTPPGDGHGPDSVPATLLRAPRGSSRRSRPRCLWAGCSRAEQNRAKRDKAIRTPRSSIGQEPPSTSPSGLPWQCEGTWSGPTQQWPPQDQERRFWRLLRESNSVSRSTLLQQSRQPAQD